MAKHQEDFRVGDPWFPEVTVRNDKTNELGEPGEVLLTIYSPAAWKRLQEQHVDEPTARVELPRIAKGVYEGEAVSSLSEKGIWRALVDTTDPFKGVEPILITVKDPFEA